MNYPKCAPIVFRHFGMRLIERYGLYITFEHYLTISGWRLKNATPVKTELEGYLTIQGVRVRVIKNKKNHRLLLTALPQKKLS